MSIIEATGLVKRYGDVIALDHWNVAVSEGTVLGLLGPNGAGKTTAVRILTTLLTPDAGSARVGGISVLAEPGRVREIIGLSGQSAAVDEYLTGAENLEMVGQLYGMRRRQATARGRELLTQFSLADAGDRPIRTYSGGMRRRLDLACALVARPPVIFLDEPTTGLDPRARSELWGVIRDLVADGATVLLTTQYLEEADQLADEIMVMNRGRTIAQGSSDDLKGIVGGERIVLTLTDRGDRHVATKVLAGVACGEIDVGPQGRSMTFPITDPLNDLERTIATVRNAGLAVLDIGVRRPTLDDVFLTLTGRTLDPSAEQPDPRTSQ